jgi:hypothetical protein
MRDGAWPLEAGIWTLGRPQFWQPLVETGSQVCDTFKTADELTAIAKLRGLPAAEAALDEMIAAVRSQLSALPEKSWWARWSNGSASRS